MNKAWIFVGLLMAASLTGCQCGPGGLLGGGLRGSGGCESGNCGLLSRLMPGSGGCPGGACAEAGGEMAQGYYAGAPGDMGGRLADRAGYRHRGHQSHMGAYPGPAMGEAAPTYGYPYYTTRGPRDFLAAQPASIGN